MFSRIFNTFTSKPTLAFLVHKCACHLSLAKNIQECLLWLSCGLRQGQSLCDGGHEAALNHVKDQHHSCGISCFPCFVGQDKVNITWYHESSISYTAHTPQTKGGSTYKERRLPHCLEAAATIFINTAVTCSNNDQHTVIGKLLAARNRCF